MNLIKLIYRTPVKKIISYSFVFAIVGAIPLSVYLAGKETQYKAGASGEQYENLEIDEASIPYPSLPPVIVSVEKPYAKIGDSILINGANFGEAQKDSFVTLGQIKLTRDDTPYWSSTQIEARLPFGLNNGVVVVTINGNTTQWNGVLTIIE